MESVFLRIGDGQDCTRTYPLSAFRYFAHNSRGHVYAVVGDRLWPVVDCLSTEMACALEETILIDIMATIQVHQRLRTPNPPACILDLDEIAYRNWVELRLEEGAEARADAPPAAMGQEQREVV